MSTHRQLKRVMATLKGVLVELQESPDPDDVRFVEISKEGVGKDRGKVLEFYELTLEDTLIGGLGRVVKKIEDLEIKVKGKKPEVPEEFKKLHPEIIIDIAIGELPKVRKELALLEKSSQDLKLAKIVAILKGIAAQLMAMPDGNIKMARIKEDVKDALIMYRHILQIVARKLKEKEERLKLFTKLKEGLEGLITVIDQEIENVNTVLAEKPITQEVKKK